jgi:DNA-binding transcriptional regulator LsrR (DeoR family)
MNAKPSGPAGSRHSAGRSAEGPSVDLLMDLATRFYLGGQAQLQIAQDLELDPSTVSRYLRRARELGIVRIEIHRPLSLQTDLGRELAEHFQLERAVVAADIDKVPRAAAEFIDSRLQHGMRLGLSWGRMLSAAIHQLSPGTVSALQIAPLHGGFSSTPEALQGSELARYVASLYPQSQVNYLNAPVLVDSHNIQQAMLRNGSIRSALEAASASEYALVGIGTLDENAPLVRDGHLSTADREMLLSDGAVGDFSTRFFNSNGEPVHALDDRLIAIEWADLVRIPKVVAIAAGAHKVDAIRGALRSKAIDILITDEPTARNVLQGA